MRAVVQDRVRGWRFAAFGGAAILSAAVVVPSVAHPPVKLSIEQEKVAAEEVADFRRKVAAAAANTKNAKGLREFYSDGFVHTTVDGARVARDAYVAALLAGTPAIETVKAEDVSITVPGGWTAIAVGRSALPAGVAGAPVPVAWTIVYARTEKSWQVVASQATRIAGQKR